MWCQSQCKMEDEIHYNRAHLESSVLLLPLPLLTQGDQNPTLHELRRQVSQDEAKDIKGLRRINHVQL